MKRPSPPLIHTPNVKRIPVLLTAPSGFTLLEVLIAMAIISIVILAMPIIPTPWTRTVELRGAAIALAGDLRLARTAAVSSSEAASIEVLGDGSGYIIQPSNIERDLPDHIALTFTQNAVSYARPESTTLSFSPLGVSSGGEFVLTSGTTSRTVLVSWPTGAIEEVPN